MPVDEYQAEVLRCLTANRSSSSPVAGGTALQQHGWRLSNDIDIFNDDRTAVPDIVRKDVASLKAAGFLVEITKRFEGLSEAVVTKEDEGSTLVQWVQYSGENFYAPVRDADFGYRLSFVDLAVNKVLAAASRRQPRDLLNLRLIAAILPMWNMLCAAPGKDASLTPLGTLNRIRQNAAYSKTQLDEAAILPEGADASRFALRVRELLDKAEQDLMALPRGVAGTLLVDESKFPLKILPAGLDAQEIRHLSPTSGDMWPSGPEIDRYLISRIVRRYGERGRKVWERRRSRQDDRDLGL